MSLVNITDTPKLWLLSSLRSILTHVRWMPKGNEDTEKRSRESRDFILGLMKSNPDAFQNELDFQNMMYLYPSRF